MNLKKTFLETASGKAAPLLLALAVLSGCATTQTLKGEEKLMDNCAIMQDLSATKGDELSEEYRRIVDFSRRCANYQLLAAMAAQEHKNGSHYPLATNAALILLAESEEQMKNAFTLALTKAGVSVENLEETRDSATSSCRVVDGGPAGKAAPGVKTVRFVCE